MSDHSGPSDLELRRIRLEERRYRTEIAKWLIIAVGAIVSFAVIDVGRLRIEKFRARAENDRELLGAYLRATESPQPEVWKRKLQLLQSFSDDQRMRRWAEEQLDYNREFAALNALYRETLKVASEVVARRDLEDSERQAARIRYEQLYWADLRFAGESEEVAKEMRRFRDTLREIEAAPRKDPDGTVLNVALKDLSDRLKEAIEKIEEAQSDRPDEETPEPPD